MSTTTNLMEIDFDDVRQIVTVNGQLMDYEVLRSLTEETKPGYWYRSVKDEAGVIRIHRRILPVWESC